MDINEAYKIHHTRPNTYSGTILYSTICIFCNYNRSNSLMDDGGSFRQCLRCRKNFRASIMNSPIANYTTSTQHLKGTN